MPYEKATTAFSDPRPVITTEEEAAASAQPKEVYLPEEMAKLLAAAEPDIQVTLELKAFSGIRTEELVRLWWVLINEGYRLHRCDRSRRQAETTSSAHL